MTDRFELPFEDSQSVQPTPKRQVFTVTKLTTTIRLILESKYPEVWVEGEISNCRLWKTGHLYFTLKDGNAQIRAVMFRSALRYLRFKPEDGLHIVARGRVSVYEPKGEYQLVAEHLDPRGLGALQLEFDQVRRKLEQEGLFDAARKRPLPMLPRKIGVVTSIDGAALGDIIHVLRRRYPDAHVVISPTRVQGEGAALDIVCALDRIQSIPAVDVIIIGRGGGSIEDLWAFNDEGLARAIGASSVPVICAVGHETDYTISDFVADVRAPTPSAAAEVVVTRKGEIAGRIDRAVTRLGAAVRMHLERQRAVAHALEIRPGLAAWPARLALRGRHAAELAHRLTHAIRGVSVRRERHAHELKLRLEVLDLRRQLSRIRTHLTVAREHLARGMRDARRVRHTHLETLAGRLEALSPLAVLARGYALCWTGNHATVVRDASAVTAGDTVRVTLHRGELECEVRKTES